MAKVLIPAIAGGVALAVVGGVAAATALHKNDVQVSVDGEVSTIAVRERTVAEVLELEGIELGAHDVVLPAADTEITDGLNISVAYGRPLQLTVDGEERTVWTTARNVGDALEQLRLDETDSKLSATRSAGIGREGLDLEIATAKDVTVTAAGKATPVRLAGTVQDVLDKQGIKPDADDKLTPAADTVLTDGLKIAFVKVDVKTSTKAKELPFEKKEVKSEKLEKGKQKVTTEGVKGKATETYTDVYNDDKLVSSTLKSTVVDTEPVDEVTTVGTKVVVEEKPEATDEPSTSGSSNENLTPAVGSSCKASYYWQGQMTANGEQFNTNDLTAAHKSLPFNTRVKVTNPSNNKSVIVRINDRGPYISGRCLDLSRAAMQAIGGTSAGVITVNYQVVG